MTAASRCKRCGKGLAMYYTEEFIATEEAIEMMKKAPKGEYSGNFEGMQDLYISIAPKREVKTDLYGFKYLTEKGKERFKAFCNAIEPIKYGLSAATANKLDYTGTNDLDTYYVR